MWRVRLHELFTDGRSRLSAAVDWFVPPAVARSELGPRARMAVGIALVMVVVFAGLAATHAVARSYREAWANVALGLMMFVGPLLVHWTGRYALSINTTLAAAFAIVIFIGGAERGAGINAATVALAEFPLFATLLLGPRLGAVWLIVSCSVSALLGVLGSRGLVENRVPPETQLFDDHVVLVVVTATLYLIAALYERGRAQGLVHIATLEAERRRAELEKIQAQADARIAHAERLASLGSIAAATAHEINNPLSYVSNNLDFVRSQMEEGLGREVSEALTEAQDGVHRIQSIVGDLKAFARPEAQVPEWVSLHAAIGTALKMAEGHTRAKARVETDLEPVPRVLATETRIVQLLLNLIVNAAHAIPDEPDERHRIVVRTRSLPERVIIEVEDTGVGMPEDVLQRLGEPFFTTKEEGLGLGLAVCRYIVDSIGGALTFESRPGRTVARVALEPGPADTSRAPPPAGNGAANSLSEAPSVRLRLLVIDDDPLVARGIVRHLRAHDVSTCNTGKEALQRLDSGARFDLILCDLMMPELSGMDVHAAIRERDAATASRMVFMTGGTFTQRAQEFRARTDNVFLEKPIDLVRLSRLVSEAAETVPKTGVPVTK